MLISRHPLRKNRRQAPTPSTTEKKSHTKRELISLCLAVLSLLGTCLTLVGYGVALSVDQFGIPPESLFTSPFEIITLSVWGILHFFTNVGKFSFLADYVDMIGQLWPALAAGLLGIGGVYFLFKLKPSLERIRQRYPRLARHVSPLRPEDGPAILVRKMLIYFVLFWFAIPVLFLVPVLLLTLASFLLSMAPFIGMAAGNAHIKNDVLQPADCMPLIKLEQRLNPQPRKNRTTYAECISIKTDRMQHDLRGRVVFSTSSSVVLFDPATGVAVRMPTRDATIQAIDRLERAPAGSAAVAPIPPAPMPPSDSPPPVLVEK